MKINERLHLVIPVYADGENETIRAYVHSAPISREAFEAHFNLISKTFASIHGEGLGEIAGPRVASLVLRAIAKQQRSEEDAISLMNEIRRLTNVLSPGPNGWTSAPFHGAGDRGELDADEISEVENAIVFFIVASAMHKRIMLKQFLSGAARLWGAQISSSNSTDFAASLPTSTVTANTGASQIPAYSVPH